jgi:hypothetical protein
MSHNIIYTIGWREDKRLKGTFCLGSAILDFGGIAAMPGRKETGTMMTSEGGGKAPILSISAHRQIYIDEILREVGSCFIPG